MQILAIIGGAVAILIFAAGVAFLVEKLGKRLDANTNILNDKD